jgi:hypothetical protein
MSRAAENGEPGQAGASTAWIGVPTPAAGTTERRQTGGAARLGFLAMRRARVNSGMIVQW